MRITVAIAIRDWSNRLSVKVGQISYNPLSASPNSEAQQSGTLLV